MTQRLEKIQEYWNSRSGGFSDASTEELPMSQEERPAWDFQKLLEMGLRDIHITVSGEPLPMRFLIIAKKGEMG